MVVTMASLCGAKWISQPSTVCSTQQPGTDFFEAQLAANLPATVGLGHPGNALDVKLPLSRLAFVSFAGSLVFHVPQRS